MRQESCYNWVLITDLPKQMVEVKKARHLTAQVLKLAKAHNVSLKSYEVALDHLADVENKVGPKADISGIYGAVRMESGIDFYNHGPKDGIVNGKDAVDDTKEASEKVS